MPNKKLGELKREQLKIAKKIVLKDDFEKIELVAGTSQAFVNRKVIAGIVILKADTMKIIEKKYAVSTAPMPYIPEFRAYRESPAIVEAFSKLSTKPDLLMLDAHGILHPRKIGMASHVGILLDVATIGIAKRLLVGEVMEDDKVYVGKEARGFSLTTKEHARPVFVSPGHKISMRSSLTWAKKTIIPPHKLPEPLHEAHKYANKLRVRLASEK